MKKQNDANHVENVMNMDDHTAVLLRNVLKQVTFYHFFYVLFLSTDFRNIKYRM